MTFTVFEAPDYFERRPSRGDFDVARRVYLGAVPGGTDWIHDDLTAEFTPADREIEVHRRSVSAGVSSEVVAVSLTLLGPAAIAFGVAFGKRMGEESAKAVIDWVRAKAQTRREASGRRLDPPPDFQRYDARELATGMQGELADLTGRAREPLELVNVERTQTTTLVAVYRDAEDGAEWEVTVERDSATFKRR